MIQPGFFLFGAARSGSTLFCALLSEHRDVFCLNDSFLYYSFAMQHGFNNPPTTWMKRLFAKLRRTPRGTSRVDLGS